MTRRGIEALLWGMMKTIKAEDAIATTIAA